MANERTAYLDQALQEILDAVADKPLTSDIQMTYVRAIEQMVRQCYALLRQNLEQKVKLEPKLYSKDRMERALQQFETVIPDIQDAIATRVADSVSGLIRQEIGRVLQDTLSDIQDAMTKTASRIMVVEDAPEYQGAVVLALLLEPSFKEIHIAASGEEALETFDRVNPELVLLDFRLPGIDGLETAKQMKKQRPDVKIVLVTAYAEEVMERAAKEANIEEVIHKADFSLARLQQLLGRE